MKEQNFSNHTKLVPAFHFFVLPVLAANFIGQFYWFFKSGFALGRILPLLLAAALITLALLARLFALKVQDRVIRLEERLRYERLLPADLQARIPELTLDQFVSLRFASDAELPGLVRKVLDEKLTNRKSIKRLVQSWRADYLRA